MGSGAECLGWTPSSTASLRQELNPLHLGPSSFEEVHSGTCLERHFPEVSSDLLTCAWLLAQTTCPQSNSLTPIFPSRSFPSAGRTFWKCVHVSSVMSDS